MFKKIVLLSCLSFSLTYQLYSQSNPSDFPSMKIDKSTDDILVISWNLDELHQSLYEKDGEYFTKLSFDGCTYIYIPRKPHIPYKEFIIAVPEGAEIDFGVSDIEYSVLENILPAPISIPNLENDKSNIYKTDFKLLDYEFLPDNILEISSQQYLKDIPLVKVKFYPISYDHKSRRVTTIKNATLNFKFKRMNLSGDPIRIDKNFSDLFINFDQIKYWRTSQFRTVIKKERTSMAGPWYGITVTEDGLYKISRSALFSAGIDIDEIDPRTIQLFNNGGRPLNVNAMSTENNPEGPVENSIYIDGEEDGSFDDEDFILFYGTQLGGWYYSNTSNDFQFIQHSYDTKNYYWLTWGQSNGKRMTEFEISSITGTIDEEYFLERLHFEEDLFNLLNSGTDWYGYSFSGLSDNFSSNYSLENLIIGSYPAKIRIKFKGGSGIKYGDNTTYRYFFTSYLNRSLHPNPIIPVSTLVNSNSMIREAEFVSTDFFNNESNTLEILYTANYDRCNAYIDWIEFYYPRELKSTLNQLLFYTNTLGQIVNYHIDGFTNNEVILFDISDPVDVKILSSELIIQQNSCDFSLDLSDGISRRLVATSLNSSSIINVSSLTEFSPGQNLLDETHQADLIVISHPEFEEYAQKIVQLRSEGSSPLIGEVVNTEDIFFYFGSGVKDPVAIRNFIRYAYNHWTSPAPAYVLLYGGGHYDYKNILTMKANYIPPFEIAGNHELNSRETDDFYVDVNLNSSSLNVIIPDIALGRLPVEDNQEASYIADKLISYENDRIKDGWQTVITFVADDEVPNNEWIHQDQAESLANISQIQRFLIKKIYLSAYESISGGFGRIKPSATEAVIDQLNQGTLIINYLGHGSEYVWSHESVLSMNRDISRIQNERKLALWIAATCTFGKFDDANDICFSEALIRRKNAGAIGVVSAARPVDAGSNVEFNERFYISIFPSDFTRRRVGDGYLLASLNGGSNYQKFHLFADPSMYLAAPNNFVTITSAPDTFTALKTEKISGFVSVNQNGEVWQEFDGGAVLIVNDAKYEDITTGGGRYYDLLGPRLFKGEVGVDDGLFSGDFIVPKSIRYNDSPSGRITVFAWSEGGEHAALGYVDTLIFNGTSETIVDTDGPQITIFFEGQENFNSGDLVENNPVFIAEINDDNGINLTQQLGHSIEVQIDNKPAYDITSFFAYNRDSYLEGKLVYHVPELDAGEHNLSLQVWDNLNNPSKEEIDFRVVESDNLVLTEVLNYPNPLKNETNFTFQTQGINAATEVEIKVYTVTGRLIKTLDGLSPPTQGFNYYYWDARDDDGDHLANGVYLYKVILKNGDEQKEVIEKLVILN